MTTRRVRRALVVLTGALMLAVGASVLQAHDLGLSRAVVVFNADGSYRIDILVDPRGLLAQLALRSGEPASAPALPAPPALLKARLPQLLDGIDVQFDGRRVSPAAEYLGAVSSLLVEGVDTAKLGDAGTLQLTGQVPAHAQTFSFAYRWTFGATALVVHQARSPEPRVYWLGAGEPSLPIALNDLVPPSAFDVAREYLALGFTHILPKGLDHILFVLGLFFLSAGWRSLLLQVTTFTVAHTLTLGLTMLGVVSLSPSIVEPLIALSIAYVALENLTATALRPTRVILIFCFGLLHGMGFAGVLKEIGFPATEFLAALLSFNVGVELGQLTVLAGATVAVAGWRRREASLFPLLARPASIAIALSGLYWTIERVW